MTNPAVRRKPRHTPDARSPDTVDMASRRRFPRYPTECPAVCIWSGNGEGSTQWDVTIINASQGGFGLSRDLPVPKHTPIIISIPEIGDFLCSIAWKSDSGCGVQLQTEIGWLTDKEARRLATGLSHVDTARRKS